MLTVIEIKEELGDRNLREVSKRSGVNYQTLWRLARYEDYNPSHATCEKLSNYLERKE
jgi:hypothetical protein